MGILDSARKHFAAVRSLEIPEWTDADGKAVVIYWRPLTAEEQGRIDRMSKATGENVAEFTARLVIEKALDAEGNKLFTLEDLRSLTTEVDFTIVNRISGAILNLTTRDEAIKN